MFRICSWWKFHLRKSVPHRLVSGYPEGYQVGLRGHIFSLVVPLRLSIYSANSSSVRVLAGIRILSRSTDRICTYPCGATTCTSDTTTAGGATVTRSTRHDPAAHSHSTSYTSTTFCLHSCDTSTYSNATTLCVHPCTTILRNGNLENIVKCDYYFSW